ncbi:hypothetical protein SGFS_064230 [Streptomyces graminofaciens]|uniref:Uncharacterized protein n=1 Tax=Streptomyces graminofaciens TaxID=68212 RepID=A0ABM9SC96_9ACTN|nr:hypothetical protein SGFS_064230 [Streptomyces graminofaciens]
MAQHGDRLAPGAGPRHSTIRSGINSAHPWADMTTDYSWSQARFKQYNNYGLGSGDLGANDPEMTDS